MFHTVRLKRLRPPFQVCARADCPSDGIRAALGGGLVGVVAELEEEFGGLVAEDLGEQTASGGAVVVGGDVGEGEDCSVEVAGCS
jgi:hypothetical protein